MVARRADRRHRAQHVRAAAGVPRAGRPRRRQHVGHHPGRGRRRRRRRHPARRPPLDPARRRPLGRRAAPARRTLHRALVGSAAAVAALARSGRDASRSRRPTAAAGRLWVARLCAARNRTLTLAGRPRPPDPLPLRRATWPLTRVPERLRHRARQRRDAERRPARSRPTSSPASSPRASAFSPLVLHTGVASLEADELPYPERVQVPVETADRVNAARAARPPGRRGRHDRRAGARDARPATTARVGPFDGWTDLVDHAGAGRAGGRRAAHRLARARGLAPADAGGGRRPRAPRRGPTRPASPRATSGTSSATCT